MHDPFFFGYGSLVNRLTHHYAETYPALLKGWRRIWRHGPNAPVAFLTAVRTGPEDAIEGLIAAVPGDDWAALDEREAAYARSDVTAIIEHPVTRPHRVEVYAIDHGKPPPPGPRRPILLSYLDVVVQGYMREFGPAGALHFFETTDGWDGPILDDRDAPRYPRHQILSPDERDCVDFHLEDLGIVPSAAV